jgi:heat shock protein HslJ
MKKIILTGLTALVFVGIGAGYYYFFKGSDYGETRPPKDLTGIIVPPVTVPLNGKSFFVPNSTNTSVSLNLVSPTAKRDYPMGKFILTESTTQGTLVALDDFTTPFENNIRAVPIYISTDNSEALFYLAILEGEDMKHTGSLLLGNKIKIQSVIREGVQVTVNYLVHDRNQLAAETPGVQTSAIFNIVDKIVVQAGRTPLNEEYHEVKTFTGEYLWDKTTSVSGTTIVPQKPEAFTLLFDTDRISLGTDCNSGSATYSAESGSSTVFKISEIATTRMFCEAGQENEYFDMFKKISTFKESDAGDLSFVLNDGSVMQFTAKKQKLEFENASSSNSR